MPNVSVLNTTNQLSGKTVAVCENDQTVSGAWTFSGNQTFTGNVTLGNAVGDSITLTGTIVSNVLFTDATYDIGASGANRPRDFHLSRNAVIGGTITVTGVPTFSASTIGLRGVTYTLPSADGSAGYHLTTNGSATLSWAEPKWRHLGSATGTTTNTSAENFATVTIPAGMTNKDTIKIIYSLESITQQTANPFFVSQTDSNVEIVETNGGNALSTANSVLFGEATIRCAPEANTRVFSADRGMRGGDEGNQSVTMNGITTIADWTAEWVLGFRHGGVTSGGTLRYSWSVYKLSGQ